MLVIVGSLAFARYKDAVLRLFLVDEVDSIEVFFVRHISLSGSNLSILTLGNRCR